MESALKTLIQTKPAAVVDYVAAVDAARLGRSPKLARMTLIVIAVRFGRARLIDNLIVEVPAEAGDSQRPSEADAD